MLEVISILLLLVVAFIVLFWMKKTLFIFGFFFKIFTFAILAFIAISILFGYIIIKDANNFSNKFGNSTSIFILKDTVNGTETFLTGVTINPSEKAFDTMSNIELKNAEELYNSGIINTIGEEYYKVFIVDFKSFEDMEIEGVEDRNINLSKDEIRRVMTSKDAKEELAEIVANHTGEDKKDILDDLRYSDEEIKSYIFTYYLSTTLDPNNMGKFLTQFKDNNIRVYEDSAMFKAIRIVPEFLMNTVTKKIQEAAHTNSTKII